MGNRSETVIDNLGREVLATEETIVDDKVLNDTNEVNRQNNKNITKDISENNDINVSENLEIMDYQLLPDVDFVKDVVDMQEWKQKQEENLPYKYWFAGLIGISSGKKIQLVREVSEKEIYEMSDFQLMQLCEYYDVDSDVILNSIYKGPAPEKIYEKAQRAKISLATFQDKVYPRKLRYINQMPYALYYKGHLPGDEVSVAIVGARKCSEYGRYLAKELGEKLAENNVSVISGLAYGIDCAAHAGALKGQGKTFGVLGCGVDICYPASAMNLYGNMIKSSGGVLSEYAPGTQPLSQFFPARNRIISGLADIVVVVEARLRSGSLITADCAIDQGKDVYAFPGRITDKNSQGTNRLIYQGAGILDDIDKFLEDVNLKHGSRECSRKEKNFLLEKEEAMLYSVLDFEPKYLDTIIEETGFSVTQVLALIDTLKRKKLVKEVYKNYFSKRGL